MSPEFKELTLDDMLADSIVRLVMQRDGVTEADVRLIFAKRRRRACPHVLAAGSEAAVEGAPDHDAEREGSSAVAWHVANGSVARRPPPTSSQ